MSLIRAAVVGGPARLEFDHFDAIAKAPPATSPQTIKLMLRGLLADRFKLVIHKDARPIQGLVLSVGKGQVGAAVRLDT